MTTADFRHWTFDLRRSPPNAPLCCRFRRGSSGADGAVDNEENGDALPNMSRPATWLSVLGPIPAAAGQFGVPRPLIVTTTEAGVYCWGSRTGPTPSSGGCSICSVSPTFPAADPDGVHSAGWHHLAHQPWRLSGGIIWAWASSAWAWDLPAGDSVPAEMLFHISRVPSRWASADRLKEAVGLLGAGIYEELLFRLISSR